MRRYFVIPFAVTILSQHLVDSFRSNLWNRQPVTTTRVSRHTVSSSVPSTWLLLLQQPPPSNSRRSASNSKEAEDEDSISYLKDELTKYLQKRQDSGADEKALQDVGKVVGGTRGNLLLEFVSGAPNKAYTIDSAPGIFDYSELEKYGFGKLATPIMKAGGRTAMYDLFGLEPPAPKPRPKPMAAPKLVIDRTGETDPSRYTGLKLGQILDDDAQARALEEAQTRSKAGQSMSSELTEIAFEQPFADRRNVAKSKLVPNFTPQSLDEYTQRQGKTVDWARKTKAERLILDRQERLEIALPQRVYSMLTGLLMATAFGKSTPVFLTQTIHLVSSLDEAKLVELLDVLKAPAIALMVAAVGSSVYCAIMASQKQRNSVVWTIKGLLGGPLTVSQLQTLSPLTVTQGDLDAASKAPKDQQTL